MRWLYHIVRATNEIEKERYAPSAFERERVVHASFRDTLLESMRIHFAGEDPRGLRVLQIDPRRLDVAVELAATHRGPMPHIHGTIPRDAIRAVHETVAIDQLPDRVTGTRWAFVAFDHLTLLDLVGTHDPISRIASMGFDPTSATEIIAADRHDVWTRDGTKLSVDRVRPPLEEFDVVIVSGGHGTRALVADGAVLEWIRAFPANRLVASVCTGSLVLGAAGRLRGRRATTHHSAYHQLAEYGATVVKERVVDAGQIVTAGGVTCGIDLGIHLVRRFEGEEVAAKIASQMEWA